MGEETQEQRLDRKLIELLNELRVALPGVQVLFAFLLIVPFNAGFSRTTEFQRDVYAASLGCAAVASMLLIAPSTYHRIRFRRLVPEGVEHKTQMLITQDRLAIGGFFFLSLAITGSVYVTFDLLFGGPVAAILAGVLTAGFGWFWYALPLSRRMGDPRHAPGREEP